MDEKHCADLLAGYALDALDGEDRLAAERHITNCPQCWAECAKLRETLHLCLGHTVVQLQPSPLVRTQFLAHLALELGPAQAQSIPGRPSDHHAPLITIPQSPPASADASRESRAIAANQRYRWALGGATVPAVVAIVLGVLFMHSQGQLSDTRDHLLSEALTSPHVAMPLSGSAVSHGMHGEVIMPEHGMSGMLIVSGISSVPAGMRYTCWVRQHGHWTESGVLRPTSSGIAMITFDKNMNLHQADGVAVTMERAPHPPAPSGPMLLSATL